MQLESFLQKKHEVYNFCFPIPSSTFFWIAARFLNNWRMFYFIIRYELFDFGFSTVSFRAACIVRRSSLKKYATVYRPLKTVILFSPTDD